MIQRQFNNNFFLQQMRVKNVSIPREEYFRMFCNGKSVLHVGCTDFPIFNPAHNLHIKIAPVCKRLDGLDTDITGNEQLAVYVPGNYYNNVNEVCDSYDLVIVPEVIEHVDNIRVFLEDLARLSFRKIFITGPCLIGQVGYGFFNYHDFPGSKQSHLSDIDDYIEEVHPDHKVWFSPYTLANTIESFTRWKVEEVVFLERKRMVGVWAATDNG